MGLFSGGFGAGLAEGLATSVSKQLTDAMDRREEELSKARVFWQTRQAQKQEDVDAENKRIKKAYERLTNEMGGDAAKGLAAYQAIGGNIDDVERYITVLNKTQEANMKYSLQNKLDFDGLNLGDYGDFTFDKGFDSIKAELTAPDISYTEAPSLLTAIGLGQDEAQVGKALQQQVEKLVPRSVRTDAGIGAATIKGNLYEGTATAEEWTRANEERDLKAIVARQLQELDNLEPGTKAHDDLKNKMENTIELINRLNQTQYTSSEASYRSGLSNALNRAIENSTVEGRLQNAKGEPIYDDKERQARIRELSIEAYRPFMGTLLNEDGSYKSPQAEAAVSLSGDDILRSMVAEQQKLRSGAAPSGGSEGLTEAQIAEEKAKDEAAKVRDNLEAQATTFMADVIRDGKTTKDDEDKFIAAIVARGKAGLDEEGLAKYEERVRSTFGPLFEKERKEKENKELEKTPEGRFKILEDAINAFNVSDAVSTATLEALDKAKIDTQGKYARFGPPTIKKQAEKRMTDILEGKAKEDLDKILVENGYDPAYIKRNSRKAYDSFVSSLITKYEQVITRQRDADILSEQKKQERNTLGNN